MANATYSNHELAPSARLRRLRQALGTALHRPNNGSIDLTSCLVDASKRTAALPKALDLVQDVVLKILMNAVVIHPIGKGGTRVDLVSLHPLHHGLGHAGGVEYSLEIGGHRHGEALYPTGLGGWEKDFESPVSPA